MRCLKNDPKTFNSGSGTDQLGGALFTSIRQPGAATTLF